MHLKDHCLKKEKKKTLINYFRYKLKESITIKNAIKK
jgi:hypothetical protein